MELRKDYFLDRWVILSTVRGVRPDDFEEEEIKENNKKCFFCPGSEKNTPPEIGRLEKDGKWYVRWFPNKFAITAREGDSEIKDHGFFKFSAGFGEHEIIVELPEHNKQLHEVSIEHLTNVLKVYAERIKELDTRNEYVTLFKNYGREAGISLIHSHTQICSVNIVPPEVVEKVEKSHDGDKCLYCDVLFIEKGSDRRVHENNSFVSFCPYASRFNYELWIMPKDHIKRLEDLEDKQFKELAEVLMSAIKKLGEKKIPYNFYFYYSPKGQDLHLHIELVPRLAKWGGFELSTGIIVNHVLPEEAAKWYRDEE